MKHKDVEIQIAHNKEHGITPKTINKKIHDVISATVESDETNQQQQTELPKKMTKKERQNNRKYRKEMKKQPKI